jgi:hypothetical protein
MKEDEREPMIGAIRGCTNRVLLERMFDRFEAAKTKDRIDALLEAMYNPEVFFSDGDIDLDKQYETLVGAFLSGIWNRDE